MEVLPLRIAMGFILQTYTLVAENQSFNRLERRKPEGKQNKLDLSLTQESQAKQVGDTPTSSKATCTIEETPFVCLDEDLWAPEQFASPEEEEEALIELEEAERDAEEEAREEEDEKASHHKCGLPENSKRQGLALPVQLQSLNQSLDQATRSCSSFVKTLAVLKVEGPQDDAINSFQTLWSELQRHVQEVKLSLRETEVRLMAIYPVDLKRLASCPEAGRVRITLSLYVRYVSSVLKGKPTMDDVLNMQMVEGFLRSYRNNGTSDGDLCNVKCSSSVYNQVRHLMRLLTFLIHNKSLLTDTQQESARDCWLRLQNYSLAFGKLKKDETKKHKEKTVRAAELVDLSLEERRWLYDLFAAELNRFTTCFKNAPNSIGDDECYAFQYWFVVSFKGFLTHSLTTHTHTLSLWFVSLLAGCVHCFSYKQVRETRSWRRVQLVSLNSNKITLLACWIIERRLKGKWIDLSSRVHF